MPGDFDTYYAENPVEAWDRNRWQQFSPEIAVNFRQNSVFSPLVVWQPYGTKATKKVAGREAIPGVINHEPIGVRQRYIDSMYVDSRQRELKADLRYGGKVQYDR